MPPLHHRCTATACSLLSCPHHLPHRTLTLQATISLAHAARGAAIDFDATVERLGVPAGFNLRGCVSIVYTKSLQVTSVTLALGVGSNRVVWSS